MPNRIIRDGINASPRVNRLSMGAEVLYRRLMTIADDYGRYHGSPTTVRAACWPTCPEKVTDLEVGEWLEECASSDRPLLRIYSVDGAKYLEIFDFGQQIRSKSKFPAPDSEPEGSVPSSGSQSDSNLLANGNQNVRTSRTAKSESKTNAESSANCGSDATRREDPDAGDSPQPQPAPSEIVPMRGVSEYPQTLEAIRQRFPTTDDFFVMRVVMASLRAYAGIADCKIPTPDDPMLAEATSAAYADSPGQEGAGLFLTTVPATVASWARYGRDRPRRRMPVAETAAQDRRLDIANGVRYLEQLRRSS